jgi:hypothetical protein
LVTGWTNPVTSLTLRSSTGDQAFDDLRLTTQSTNTPPPPTNTLQQTQDYLPYVIR